MENKNKIILDVLLYRKKQKEEKTNLTSTSHFLTEKEFVLVNDFFFEFFNSFEIKVSNKIYTVEIPILPETNFHIENELIEKLELEKNPVRICNWKKINVGMYSVDSWEYVTDCKKNYDGEQIIIGNYCLNCGGKHEIR